MGQLSVIRYQRYVHRASYSSKHLITQLTLSPRLHLTGLICTWGSDLMTLALKYVPKVKQALHSSLCPQLRKVPGGSMEVFGLDICWGWGCLVELWPTICNESDTMGDSKYNVAGMSQKLVLELRFLHSGTKTGADHWGEVPCYIRLLGSVGLPLSSVTVPCRCALVPSRFSAAVFSRHARWSVTEFLLRCSCFFSMSYVEATDLHPALQS